MQLSNLHETLGKEILKNEQLTTFISEMKLREDNPNSSEKTLKERIERLKKNSVNKKLPQRMLNALNDSSTIHMHLFIPGPKYFQESTKINDETTRLCMFENTTMRFGENRIRIRASISTIMNAKQAKSLYIEISAVADKMVSRVIGGKMQKIVGNGDNNGKVIFNIQP